MIAASLCFIYIGFYSSWKTFLIMKKILKVYIQFLKRHKLKPPPPKRRSDVFHSKIDLRVAPDFNFNFNMIYRNPHFNYSVMICFLLFITREVETKLYFVIPLTSIYSTTLLLKKDSGTGVFLWIFKNTFSYKTLPVAASVNWLVGYSCIDINFVIPICVTLSSVQLDKRR